MAQEKERCGICALLQQEGIRVNGGFICSACLEAISNTAVADPQYAFYVEKLKGLWLAG